MSAKLSSRLIDHMMTSLEAIAGMSGKNATRNMFRNFDRKYIRPMLLREFNSKDEKLLNAFKKINELNVNKIAENPDFVLRSKSTNNIQSFEIQEPAT